MLISRSIARTRCRTQALRKTKQAHVENKTRLRRKKEQGAKPCEKQKKSRARSPALKIVSTLFPRKLDLILIDGLTLLAVGLSLHC
jgi:hypothetical protein